MDRIGFLGGGNMANALIGGLLATGVRADAIIVGEPLAAAREALAARYGVCVEPALGADALREIDIVVLAVKPQQMREAVAPFAGSLDRQVVLSIAAGLPIALLSRWLGGYPRIVRAMPNTPALIRAGITGLCAAGAVDAAGRALAERLMAAVGATEWFADEAQMDAVTAISGSGPAYFFMFMEALQQGGERMGFAPEVARRLAVHTALGAAQLAAQGDEPLAVLRERVTSKGGTTAAALDAMRARGVADGIVAGTEAALARGRELAAQLAGG